MRDTHFECMYDNLVGRKLLTTHGIFLQVLFLLSNLSNIAVFTPIVSSHKFFTRTTISNGITKHTHYNLDPY